MKKTFLISFLILTFQLSAQELPYKSILKAPESVTVASITARMIDGLGYRYHWATQGLKHQDLIFGPEGEGRNIKQTMDHIYVLCLAMQSAVDSSVKVNYGTIEDELELRKKTLNTISAISVKLRTMSDAEMEEVRFNRLPLWNFYNGPLADAIYHTGQIVLLRRMSGNPMNPKVNVLTGVNNN